MVKQFREAKIDIPIVGADFSQDAVKSAGASFDTYVFATDYTMLPARTRGTSSSSRPSGEVRGGSRVLRLQLLRAGLCGLGSGATGAARVVIHLREALQQALIQNPVFKSLYGGTADSVGIMTFDIEAHTVSKPMGIFGVKGGKAEFCSRFRQSWCRRRKDQRRNIRAANDYPRSKTHRPSAHLDARNIRTYDLIQRGQSWCGFWAGTLVRNSEENSLWLFPCRAPCRSHRQSRGSRRSGRGRFLPHPRGTQVASRLLGCPDPDGEAIILADLSDNLLGSAALCAGMLALADEQRPL